MPRKFAEIAFTPAVKVLQDRYGSRQTYENFVAKGPANDKITTAISQFITERNGFYLSTVTSEGWPYVQFRGGPPGFLRVLDEQTLGFADFAGNSQYLSTGNLTENNRVFLFLMDYANRRRLKIWGHATVSHDDPALIERLKVPGYSGQAERAILIQVVAWDRNCPQHIPVKYSEHEVAQMVEPLQARIAELEAQLAQAQKSTNLKRW
ncbi:MAG: pyridoxamine 5'-phosphate oxidase family protein [Spirulina sp. SIO3F2]|nr:pyridoxamine 5'-phosphate oxidase family protein [Spirulina sp. SIO3F2]